MLPGGGGVAGAWLLALCVYSAQAGPLDTAKPGAGDQPSPFIIVAQSVGPGDPFNDNTDRVAEASVLESVHVVTPANFIPRDETAVKTSTVRDTSTTTTTTTSTTTEAGAVAEAAEAAVEDNEVEAGVSRDHWVEVSSFPLGGESSSSLATTVTKYQSQLTGLTVVLARAESPIVNGYFCLATEAMDNDGLPHTLEHLIFLGSEDYPYKEVLDLLANRALADRTNAWTDTDHTCYTVYTAGPSGFLAILPVYLDHILYPLLREEDYLTEVHHINGEGHDAGVVYSEMQGVEQSTANIMYFSLAEKLYPGTGYYRETGGYLGNLRNSTNIAKVRAYHEQFYRPENLVLTITGRVDEEELFATLAKTEEKVLRKRKAQGCAAFERPWSQPVNKLNLTEDLVYEIDYPSEDETLGSIAVAWRLEEKISSSVERLEAYKLVLSYLTSTQVSPLELAFVETSDPLATSVSADTLEVGVPSLLMEFENVPVDRIDEVIPKLDATLASIVAAGPEQFDLERITNFIDQEVVSNLKDAENSPHLFVPDATVLDQLYGERPGDLETFVKLSQANKQYLAKDSAFWIDLIRTQFIESPKIVLKGKPSRRRLEELSQQEEARLARQVEQLGPGGLREKQRQLEAALESQHLPGEEVLEKIPLGSVDTIQFRSFETYNRTLNQDKLINFEEIPFKVQVEDVNSNFVQLYLFLSTARLSARQRELLPLLLDTWMSSPLIKDGVITDIETVVKRRSRTLLAHDYYLGFSGSTFSPGAYSDSIIVEAQCEREKFSAAVSFLSDVLTYPHFTGLKVNTTAANLLSNIPSFKQSATDVLRALHDGIFFDDDNNIHYTNFVRQKRVLEEVLETIKTSPERIVQELEEISASLATAENAFLFLASDVEMLVREQGAGLPVLHTLLNTTQGSSAEELAGRFVVKSEHLYRADTSDRPQHVAFGVGGTESCYLKQSVAYNNTDWTDPAAAAERVMLQYLSDRMYDEVRGQGLTYGVSLALSITEGRATLSLTRSSQLVEAYTTVREILQRFLADDDEWTESLAASAKGSLIYSWTEKEETVEDLVGQTVKAYMRQTDTKYNRDFVLSLGRVTVSDVREAARALLPGFLAAASSQTVVVCPPATLDTVLQDLSEAASLELTKYTDLEQTFLFE